MNEHEVTHCVYCVGFFTLGYFVIKKPQVDKSQYLCITLLL